MLVPLSMTLYFSFIRYVLNSLRRPEWTSPSFSNWRGFGNYNYVLDAKDFWFAVQNSVFIVGGILFFTVILGLSIAVLINKTFPGRGIVRVLLISPFFVMPAVSGVLWINMMLDPVLGLNGIAVEKILITNYYWDKNSKYLIYFVFLQHKANLDRFFRLKKGSNTRIEIF